jgi:hypothetical protein
MQRLGQRTDQQRFSQARHAFQQGMPAGEDCDQHLLDDLVLANDHLGQFIANAVIGLLAPLNGGDVFSRRTVGHGNFSKRK